jgi:hypothetical protein
VSAQDSLDGQRLPSADNSKVTQTEDHHQSEQLDFREPAEVGMRSTVDAPDRWDPMRHEAGAFYPPQRPMLTRLPQRTTLTLALLGRAAPASARRCLSPSFFVYPSRHDDGGPCCDASL